MCWHMPDCVCVHMHMCVCLWVRSNFQCSIQPWSVKFLVSGFLVLYTPSLQRRAISVLNEFLHEAVMAGDGQPRGYGHSAPKKRSLSSPLSSAPTGKLYIVLVKFSTSSQDKDQRHVWKSNMQGKRFLSWIPAPFSAFLPSLEGFQRLQRFLTPPYSEKKFP